MNKDTENLKLARHKYDVDNYIGKKICANNYYYKGIFISQIVEQCFGSKA